MSNYVVNHFKDKGGTVYDIHDSRIANTLPIANGGTGATTAEDARTNLDVYSKDEVDGQKMVMRANGTHCLQFLYAKDLTT